MDITNQLVVGVTETLGVVATVAAVLVWRAAALPASLDQILLAIRVRRRGWWSTLLSWLMLLRVTQLIALSASVAVCVYAFVTTFKYLDTVDLLLGPNYFDSGYTDRLAVAADILKKSSWRAGAVAVFFTIAEYSIELFARLYRLSVECLPREAHPFIVPHEWRFGPAAMWDHRIHTIPEPLLSSDARQGWRSNWHSWAEVVTVYFELSVHRNRRAIDALRTLEPRSDSE